MSMSEEDTIVMAGKKDDSLSNREVKLEFKACLVMMKLAFNTNVIVFRDR